jgi:SpoVK/Ycf46/Vps4 family AAA+-type ATPase
MRLAGQFDLNLPAIQRVAREAAPADQAVTDEEVAAGLWSGCLAQTRVGLDQLAQRLDARATWAQLKLPAEEEGLLRQIERQVAHRARVYDTFGFRERMRRGLGISVLFAGESGTGKTMAAEVLAGELDLDLYRIDLSGVVSKYIGETEKNLRKVFDAAEAGGAILFFDEADALFGKRSEVRDSHDRYANIEINYLLQRMDGYRGVAVLATNMRSALDPSFLRRLRFVVEFPFPDAPLRERIWKAVLPSRAEVADLDFQLLSSWEIAGGNIRNIAVNAAFQAAADGVPIGMPQLARAARREYDKIGKLIRDDMFGPGLQGRGP